MDIQLINQELLKELQEKAESNERLRINFDLRTTPEDTSQRMLNALQPGTHIPIHRHLKTSETVICLEGCLDWVFYEEAGHQNDGEWPQMKRNSLKQGVSECVLGRDNTAFRCLWEPGIQSLYMSQVPSLRPRTEPTGNEEDNCSD